MHREEDREGRSAPAGGSGGGTQDRWTEEDFKQRVRERLDRIEEHGEGPSGRSEGRDERRSHRETWAGCIVSLTTPTMSSLRAPRSVSLRNLDKKASNAFLASYLLR